MASAMPMKASPVHPPKITTVKALVESTGSSSIPSFYNFTPYLRDEPIAGDAEDSVPIIDISLLVSGTPEQQSQIIHQLSKACSDWGCFMVINHDVTENLTKAMIASFQEFFHLPEEEKKEYQGNDVMDPIRCGTGFNPSMDKANFWRDFLKCFAHPEFHTPNKPGGFSEIAREFSRRNREVIIILLKAISKSLGLEESYVEKAANFELGLQLLAANYYPACPEPEKAIGIPAHYDHGLLTTLVNNGVSGLQVKHNGKWFNVNIPPNVLFVQVADHLERYDNDRPLGDIKYDRTTFWVQVHGLPMRYMTVEAAEKICGVVGNVIKQSDPKVYDGGNFIRVKVTIDITMPLCRGRLISLKDDKQVWVSFKYERLPNLCYWCGRLTHDDRDCEIWIDSEGTLKNDQRQFSSSLRAAPFMVSKKNTIVVPGYYSTRKMNMKAGETSAPMEEEQPIQSDEIAESEQAPISGDHYMQGIVKHSMGNNHNGINSNGSEEELIGGKRYLHEAVNHSISNGSSCANGSESESTKVNKESQSIGEERYLHEDVNQPIRSGNRGVNPIDQASMASSVHLFSNLNGKSSCAIENEADLMKENDATQKSEVLGISPNTFGVLKARDNPSDTSPGQLNEVPLSHVPDGVSNFAMQGRVLPTWTRRSRPPTTTGIPLMQVTVGRKRQPHSSLDFSELPSKRFQASQNDDGALFRLAEADDQPRQAP